MNVHHFCFVIADPPLLLNGRVLPMLTFDLLVSQSSVLQLPRSRSITKRRRAGAEKNDSA
jgi:hypothetical protein